MPGNEEIGVIFDLDGTLVASEILYFRSTEEILAPTGRSLRELTPVERSRIPGRSAVVNMEFYRLKFGLETPAEELVRVRLDNLIGMVNRDGVAIIPGARSFLDALNDGGFRLAVASSAPRPYVETVLRKTSLEGYFSVVATGSEVSRFKPDPEIFLQAGQRLGIPADRCMVVEDAHSGIMAARAAGMKVLAVRSDYTLIEQYELADRLVDDYRGLDPMDVTDILGVAPAGGES